MRAVGFRENAQCCLHREFSPNFARPTTADRAATDDQPTVQARVGVRGFRVNGVCFLDGPNGKETNVNDQDEDAAPGWDAINAELALVYGDQEPLHQAAVPHYRLGGTNPLDGISVYRNPGPPAHWHFVSYGLVCN